MKKKIILSEAQLKKIMEVRVNDFNIEDIAHALETIPCSGASLKNLVADVLKKYGYEEVKVLFLGHDEETKDLRFMVYTEGPIFVYKAKSEISAEDKPCLTVYDLKVYQQI